MRFIEETAVSYAGDKCLIWPFGRTVAGYAMVTKDGHPIIASRVVCELAHGPAPSPTHEASFSCGNGHLGCINPQHLSWRLMQEIRDTMSAEGRTAKGPQMPHHKLNEKSVRAMRRIYPSVSAKELGKQFGVCESTVFAVLKRKKWAWVT